MKRRKNLYSITDDEYRKLQRKLDEWGITQYALEIYLKLPFNTISHCVGQGAFTKEEKEKILDFIKTDSNEVLEKLLDITENKKRQSLDNKQDGFVPLEMDHQAEMNYLVDKYGCVTQIPDFGVSVSTLHRILKGTYKRVNQTVADKLHDFCKKEMAADRERQTHFDFGDEFSDSSTGVAAEKTIVVNESNEVPETETAVGEDERKLEIRQEVEQPENLQSNPLINNCPPPEPESIPEDLKELFEQSLKPEALKAQETQNEVNNTIWTPMSLTEAFAMLKMRINNGASQKTLFGMIKEIAKRFQE